jgi:DNA polymerase elongation subunit (family B)
LIHKIYKEIKSNQMTTLLLHVFDTIARDQRILRATEEELEVEYISGEESDGSEYTGYRKKGSKKNSSYDNRELVIHLFGTTADARSARVEVTGFRPYFFVQLPACTSASEEQKLKHKLEEYLKIKCPKHHSQIQYELVHKQKLIGYTANKIFPFVKLSFPSMGLFYETRKIFLDENQQPKVKLPGTNVLKVYESNIDPMLRFFHLRNLQPCGWMNVRGVELDTEDTSLVKLRCEWEDISPSAPPEKIVSAPFYHAFWDIEVYSHDGEFPVATQGYRRVAKQLLANGSTPEEISKLLLEAFTVKDSTVKIPPLLKAKYPPTKKEVEAAIADLSIDKIWDQKDRVQELTKLLDMKFKRIAPLAGDPIIQIGTTTWKMGSSNSEKHIFVLGGCDSVPNSVVHTYSTEKELLLGWFEWVIQENFDVFVGYNIFGFDEKYVWDRLVELGLEQEEYVQQLTRLWDEGGEMKMQEKFLSSSALGDNMLYMWNTPGRLRIDLLGHVRRKTPMPSYKLDSVAAAFMSGSLSGIEKLTSNSWILKTKQKGDARIGRYVQILDEMGEDLSDKMMITEISSGGIVVESEEDLLAVSGEARKWAVVKDDLPPKEIFSCHRGSDTDRARIAAYCIQDCDLVLELYKKLDVFNEAMSMANVCSVPISYIFTRGQGIKIESLIFKECMLKNQLIEVIGKPQYGVGVEDSYEGAIVLDPEPGFYADSPIGVCDFSSLYPSTIISENISHDMLISVKDYDLQGKLVRVKYESEISESEAPKGTRWTDIEFDIWRPDPSDTRKNPVKKRVGVRVCRYAQPPGDVKGTLPEINAMLLAARKAKRAEIPKTDDPFKKALLDAEQNAYKITGNSLYGQLGSATFKIRWQELAASVTAYGRKQILFSKAAIEKFYGKEANDARCEATITYGDTDSIFVNFNPKNPETGERLTGREAVIATMELTEEAGKFITKALKPPHDFEYDKVFYPFIIFSKKRYVGNKYEDSPDEFKETSMGIVLKRRDNAPILKMCYGAAINMLLNHKNIPKAVEEVKKYVKELVEGKMKLSQLTITKSLRAEYAATPPAHKMLADRIKARDPGNAPASGERLGYVYIQASTGQEASKLQGERVETPSYILEKGLKPDAEYYIDHQLYNPLAQLFGIMVEQMPGYVPPTRGWSEDLDKRIAQREVLAGELLFKDGLSQCKKLATRNFMKMFGCEVLPSEKKKTGESSSKGNSRAQPMTAKQQMSLKSFLKDTAMIEDQYLAKGMLSAKRQMKNKEK